MTGHCHYCGPTDRELRPYGPGGSTVCFPCATTPERDEETAGRYLALLEAASIFGPVLIDGENGPTNLDPDDLGS